MATYIVCYDVSDNGRRAKIAKALKTHGKRIQRSVFIIEVTEAGLQRITKTVSKLIQDEDSILFFIICQNCLDKAHVYAKPTKSALVV